MGLDLSQESVQGKVDDQATQAFLISVEPAVHSIQPSPAAEWRTDCRALPMGCGIVSVRSRVGYVTDEAGWLISFGAPCILQCMEAPLCRRIGAVSENF